MCENIQVVQIHVLYVCHHEALDINLEGLYSLLGNQLEQVALKSERRCNDTQELGLNAVRVKLDRSMLFP